MSALSVKSTRGICFALRFIATCIKSTAIRVFATGLTDVPLIKQFFLEDHYENAVRKTLGKLHCVSNLQENCSGVTDAFVVDC